MSGAVRPADNPFASGRLESLSFHGGPTSQRGLERRIDDLGGRVAIVGPRGSGKTTLLEEFAAVLTPPVTLIRITGTDPHPFRRARSPIPELLDTSHTILVDGAERLGAFSWRRFLFATRSAGRLVAALHRPGRLPTLVTCETDPELLRTLVSRLAPQDTTDIEDLFNRHGGNIRECFRELYDVYAGRRRNVSTFRRFNV